jgi:hypothetical protein
MTAPELTEELIAAAMKGRCKVGWVVRKSGRESWDVWLEVATGLVKLVPQANA